MKTFLLFISIVFALVLASSYTFAGQTMLACVQPDGSVLYTNKDVKGCVVLKMPELSIVPAYPETGRTLERSRTFIPEIPTATNHTHEPIASENEVVAKTCALYKEWILINERTKGGFEYNDVEDTKHRLYLTKIFGSGFSPSMCKEQ
jgi:hypothetical protein